MDGSLVDQGQQLKELLTRVAFVSEQVDTSNMAEYMIIETCLHGPEPVYARFRSQGRMLPDGLIYIDSWLTADGQTCYQLMKTNEPARFAEWMSSWDDLVAFEICELGAKPTGAEA